MDCAGDGPSADQSNERNEDISDISEAHKNDKSHKCTENINKMDDDDDDDDVDGQNNKQSNARLVLQKAEDCRAKYLKISKSYDDSDYDDLFKSVLNRKSPEDLEEKSVHIEDGDHQSPSEDQDGHLSDGNDSDGSRGEVQTQNENTPECSEDEADVPEPPHTPRPHKLLKRQKRHKRQSLQPKKLEFNDSCDPHQQTKSSVINQVTKSQSKTLDDALKKDATTKEIRRKTPIGKESMKDVMIKRDLIEEGTWVQCCDHLCQKWRHLQHIHDPAKIPEFWVCSMNSVTIYDRWPGMVELDPDTDCYAWVSPSDPMTVTHFHIVFFDETVSRAWIPHRSIQPYRSTDETHTSAAKGCNYMKSITAARRNADNASELSLKERIHKYSFSVRYNGKWGYVEPHHYGSKSRDGARKHKEKNKNHGAVYSDAERPTHGSRDVHLHRQSQQLAKQRLDVYRDSSDDSPRNLDSIDELTDVVATAEELLDDVDTVLKVMRDLDDSDDEEKVGVEKKVKGKGKKSKRHSGDVSGHVKNDTTIKEGYSGLKDCQDSQGRSEKMRKSKKEKATVYGECSDKVGNYDIGQLESLSNDVTGMKNVQKYKQDDGKQELKKRKSRDESGRKGKLKKPKEQRGEMINNKCDKIVDREKSGRSVCEQKAFVSHLEDKFKIMDKEITAVTEELGVGAIDADAKGCDKVYRKMNYRMENEKCHVEKSDMSGNGDKMDESEYSGRKLKKKKRLKDISDCSKIKKRKEDNRVDWKEYNEIDCGSVAGIGGVLGSSKPEKVRKKKNSKHLMDQDGDDSCPVMVEKSKDKARKMLVDCGSVCDKKDMKTKKKGKIFSAPLLTNWSGDVDAEWAGKIAAGKQGVKAKGDGRWSEVTEECKKKKVNKRKCDLVKDERVKRMRIGDSGGVGEEDRGDNDLKVHAHIGDDDVGVGVTTGHVDENENERKEAADNREIDFSFDAQLSQNKLADSQDSEPFELEE